MTSETAPTRRGRPPKQRPISNPACSNEACLVTCHPACPNLLANIDQAEWARRARGDDPTIRSTDVAPLMQDEDA
jgi:hypothetical protein